MRFKSLMFGLLLLAPLAHADLLTFTALDGSWAAAQSTSISGGARSLRINNPLTVPINVRVDVTDADSGAADVRVDAGDTLILTFVDAERPGEVAVYGDGGGGIVYVETFSAAIAVEGSDRVTVGLSSATPVVAGTAAAGTSALGSRADHVHPVQGPGTVTQTSVGSETSNTRRVTWTVADAAGSAVARACHVELYTATMAVPDDSATAAFSLITGTALSTDTTASNVRMWVTSSGAGVVAVDVIDKSGSLSGNLIAICTCPGVGHLKVSVIAFT